MARARRALAQTQDLCRVAYYGENGFGKTTMAADMAHLGEVAVVAAEPGFRHKRLASLGIPVDNLQLALATFDVNTPDVTGAELDSLFYDLRQEYQDRAATAPVGLILDTWTEVQKVIIDEVRIEELARAKRKAAIEHVEYEQSDYFVDVGWHGIVVTQMNRLLRQFRDLPCHWAICCQEERREPFRGQGRTSIGPANSPAVQADVMGYSDFVIRLQVRENPDDPKNPWRIGRTIPHDGIAKAKDRDGVLPETMAFPTFTRVLGYYTGEITRETDPLQLELDDLLKQGVLVEHSDRPRRVRASELAKQGNGK